MVWLKAIPFFAPACSISCSRQALSMHSPVIHCRARRTRKRVRRSVGILLWGYRQLRSLAGLSGDLDVGCRFFYETTLLRGFMIRVPSSILGKTLIRLRASGISCTLASNHAAFDQNSWPGTASPRRLSSGALIPWPWLLSDSRQSRRD